LKTKNICLAAIVLVGTAMSAFGQVTVIATPEQFTFNLSSSGTQEQTLVLQLSSGQTTQLAVSGSGVLVNGVTATTVTTGDVIKIRPASGAYAGLPGSISIGGSGVTPRALTVTFTGTGTGAGGSFYGLNSNGTPLTGLTFQQSGTSVPPVQYFTLGSTTGTLPFYVPTISYTSGTPGWLTINPPVGQLTQAPTVFVTPNTSSLSQGTYSATLTLTPTTTGVNTISIPITLTVGTGTGGTGTFTFTPNPVTFTFPTGTTTPITQYVAVSSATSTPFTASPSANLAGIMQVSQSSTVTPATLTITLYPNFVTTGLNGTINVSAVGSTVVDTAIPVYINTAGTGSGTLLINPSALTFNTIPGSASVPNQTVLITSSDFSQQSISVTSTSTNNFLTVVPSSNVTPSTLTVGVNPSVLPNLGTYSGSITVTPLSGAGTGVPSMIPVTVNVSTTGGGGGVPGTITLTPTNVTLTAKAGDQVVQGFVQVTTANGSPVSYTSNVTTASGGNWLSVISAEGTFPNGLTISANTKGLAPGDYNGTVNIVTQTGTTPIPVKLTVQASGTITLSQSALTFSSRTTETTAPPSQTVQITSSGAALPWTATAATTTGGSWLQVSPASGTTPGTLTISVNPTGVAAGTHTGTVTVASTGATNSPLTITVTLNQSAIATPVPTPVSNAASFIQSGASPGMIATVRGTDLGPSTGTEATPSSTAWPTTVSGVQVLFDNVPAPLLYVSATQINLVVPFEVSGRASTKMVVVNQGVRSAELDLAVREANPALFTANQSGSGAGAISNQNGTANTPSNPEARGNIIVMYATGFGLLAPAPGTGRIVGVTAPYPTPLGQVRVRIGGMDAEVLYAGAAPGYVAGLIQINARIPSNAGGSGVTFPANLPVQLQVGDQNSASQVTVSVR